MDLSKSIDSSCIVFSIDIGTSNSSVTFLSAREGDSFEQLRRSIYRVDTWPDHTGTTIEIPTRLCYKDGKPIKYGQNAKAPSKKQPNAWHLVEAFKRHVNRLGSNDISPLDRGDFPPFPKDVTLEKIYEDWLEFLYRGSLEFFQKQLPGQDTGELWRKRLCVFVAPNAWNEPEQAHLRQALLKSGWVSDEKYVRFARESEATFHYCLFHGLQELASPAGLGFLVCNAGAATTDLGFYKVLDVRPLHYSEVRPAISFEAGSIIAHSEAAVGAGGAGGANDDDDDTGDPVDAMVKNLHSLIEGADVKPKYLVLAGGFGREPEVRERISSMLSNDGITVLAIPHVSKNSNPTVDGALYSCLHNFITARALAYTYGCEVVVPFNKNKPEHRRRKITSGTRYIAGKHHLPYAWSTIASEGENVIDGHTRTGSFTLLFGDLGQTSRTIEAKIYATKESDPEWVYESSGKPMAEGVQVICSITGILKIDDMQVEEIPIGTNRKQYLVRYFIDIDFASVTSHANIWWKTRADTVRGTPTRLQPPVESDSAWTTNKWQKTGEPGKPPPEPTPPEPTPPEPTPFGGPTANLRASLPQGIHTLRVMARDKGYACYDEKGSTKEISGRDNDQSSEIEWVLRPQGELKAFTLRPYFGGDQAWNDNNKPYVGLDGLLAKGSRLSAWAPSAQVIEWYATHTEQQNSYHIRSVKGNYAMSMDDGDYGAAPKVILKEFDKDDTYQIWRLTRVPKV